MDLHELYLHRTASGGSLDLSSHEEGFICERDRRYSLG